MLKLSSLQIRYIRKVKKPLPWKQFIVTFVIMAVFVRVLFTVIDILVLNMSSGNREDG